MGKKKKEINYCSFIKKISIFLKMASITNNEYEQTRLSSPQLNSKPREIDANKLKTFIIDCSILLENNLMKLEAFEKFLKQAIKIEGRLGLTKQIEVSSIRNQIVIVCVEIPFSKRYLKYLTKKFIKKNLSNYSTKIVSSNNKCCSYILKYFAETSDGNLTKNNS